MRSDYRCHLDEDAFATLVKVLEAGIDMVRASKSLVSLSRYFNVMKSSIASSAGDPRLRLEKYLTEIVCLFPFGMRLAELTILQYLHLADLPESALAVWKMAVKHYKNSYLAWTSYTDVLMCVLFDSFSDERA